MKRLENQRLTSLRRPHSEHRANHGAVTVAPERGAFDFKRIQKGHHLLRGPLVKIHRHLAGHARRAPVSSAVRNKNSKLALKRFDLPFEWIHSISPSAMKKNERSAEPEFPVVNSYRTDFRRVRRLCQLHKKASALLVSRVQYARRAFGTSSPRHVTVSRLGASNGFAYNFVDGAAHD